MRQRIVTLLLAMVTFYVLIDHRTVFACSPAPPTPWYKEQLSVDDVPLPNGVSLLKTDDRTVVLTNNSSTPLYVIGSLDITGDHDYDRLPVTLPSGKGPIHKLLNRQVFTWGPKIVDDDKPPILAWDEDMFSDNGLEISVWQDYIGAGRGPLASINEQNKVGDDRPADLSVPVPQHTSLTFVYKDQMIEAPLTVSYVLNAQYDAQSVSRTAGACQGYGGFTLWASLFIVGAVIVFWKLSQLKQALE